MDAFLCPPRDDRSPALRVAPTAAPWRREDPLSSPEGHVVVVDDELMIVDALTRILRRHGYSVAGYHDPCDALVGLTDADPAVVVCDLMMPHLTGRALYEAVMRRRPDLATRFVFMTGGGLSDDVLAFVMEPGRTCLSKPLDLAKLLATLRGVRARGLAPR